MNTPKFIVVFLCILSCVERATSASSLKVATDVLPDDAVEEEYSLFEMVTENSRPSYHGYQNGRLIGAAYLSSTLVGIIKSNMHVFAPRSPSSNTCEMDSGALVGTTVITRTTDPHVDLLPPEEGKSRVPVVGEFNVAFIPLNSNPDAYFQQGGMSVPIVKNSLVQFKGNEPHNTVVKSGVVNMLGPFQVGPFGASGILMVGMMGSTPGGGGDPHFTTFSGQLFSYQGECELVMVHSSGFASGKGIDIHIRTTRIDRKVHYSFISGIAIQIGTDVFEVKPDGSVIIDGSLVPDVSSFAGFSVIKSLQGKKKQIIQYDLLLSSSNGATDTAQRNVRVRANTKTGMLYVSVGGKFHDSVGLLGAPDKNELLARDGVTDMTGDWKAYGEEWQVRSTEPKLFQESSAPQHPAPPVYEMSAKKTSRIRRRLMEDSENAEVTMEDSENAEVTMKNAETTCAMFQGLKKQFCIEDAMAIIDLVDDFDAEDIFLY